VIQTFFLTFIALFLHHSIWCLIAVRKKRRDFADLAWGSGFLLVAWLSFLLNPFSYYGILINLLITLWSIRIFTHIFLRTRHQEEDFRYKQQSFLQAFFLQAGILFLIALPLLWIHLHPQQLSFDYLWFGIPFWLTGFILETVSDYQLSRFKKENSHSNKLLTTGLWSYCRHPNYLGEIVQWWAIWILTLSLPFGWLFIISPLLLTFLIVRISGIAPAEKSLSRHSDFAEYKKTTPALLPPPFINGTLYTIAWILIVSYGAKGSLLIPCLVFVLNYSAQIYLFFKWDKESLYVCIPLSIYAFCIAIVQETIFIQSNLLIYSNQGLFPPLWLLFLYPLFALTLNSSFLFLNTHLLLSFLIGGSGALLSYLSGERLGGVQIISPFFFPIAFIFWGTYLTVLIVLNRKLTAIREKYTSSPLFNQEKSQGKTLFHILSQAPGFRFLFKLHRP
jgi:steroid 5-alpha reductase family enzyme